MCLGILGSLAAECACCCGTAACGLCCKAFKTSTSTRIGYAIFLLLGSLTSFVMLIPKVEDSLKKIPALCKQDDTYFKGFANCDLVVGYLAVYRVCFAMAAFFFLMSVLTIYVKTSKDPRGKFHNGFWFIKLLILFALSIAAFYIPRGEFSRVWYYFGLIGGFCFILIQLVLLVDFAHYTNEVFLTKIEDSESPRCWTASLVIILVINYGVTIVGTILSFVYYTTSNSCGANKLFISLNLVLCIAISVQAILPKVQNAQPRSGLLQASVVSMYATYLVWSAMNREPNSECNPGLMSIVQNIIPSNKTTSATPTTTTQNTWNGSTITSVLITVLCVIYSCVRSSSQDSVNRLTKLQVDKVNLLSNEEAQSDDEEDGVSYSYSFYHVMLLLASLFVMMTLTHWNKPSEDLKTLQNTWPSVWVTISSSWVCLLLYMWTLWAPVILDRDFD